MSSISRLVTTAATALFLAISCQDRIYYVEPCLVVEGWIESGENPVVFVSSIIPAKEEPQSIDSIGTYILRYATVKITDDSGTSETMVRKRSDKYLFRYYYTTKTMKGEPGGSYSISVVNGKYGISAQTSIPPSVKLNSLECRPVDSLYTIIACFDDDPSQLNNYKLFVKEEGVDSTFVPTYLGDYSDASKEDGHFEVPIYKSARLGESSAKRLFHKGDKVQVRLATLDDKSFNYWKGVENNTTFSLNPNFSLSFELDSNIEGGMGYWCGYGISDPLSITVE